MNNLSSNKSVFDNPKDFYNNALSSSGLKDNIKFNRDFNENISRNKNRKRKIIWFSPPYISNVSTSIGKRFLTIVDRHCWYFFWNLTNYIKSLTGTMQKSVIAPCLTLLVSLIHTIKRLSTTVSQNHLHLLVIVIQKHLVLWMVTICHLILFTSLRQTHQI